MTHLPGPPHGQHQPYEQAQAPLQPVPPVQSRSNIGKAIFITAVIMLVFGWWFVSNSKRPAGAPVSPVSTVHTVAYDIAGSAGSMSITATSPTGTEQASGRALPAHLTYQMESGAFAYVSAQNEGEAGSITCTIRVDGQVISTNRSEGAYTIATCKGRVP